MSTPTAEGPPRIERRAVTDPDGEGRRLAETLGARVASDPDEAERAMRALTDAGRALVQATAEDDALLARAEEIRAAASVPAPCRP